MRLSLGFAVVLAWMLAPMSALAADTWETFELGASDFEFYAGYEGVGLKRIELTVFADNAAAIRLYEKFGFELEGTHRAYAYRDGQFADALCMARLRA